MCKKNKVEHHKIYLHLVHKVVGGLTKNFLHSQHKSVDCVINFKWEKMTCN